MTHHQWTHLCQIHLNLGPYLGITSTASLVLMGVSFFNCPPGSNASAGRLDGDTPPQARLATHHCAAFRRIFKPPRSQIMNAFRPAYQSCASSASSKSKFHSILTRMRRNSTSARLHIVSIRIMTSMVTSRKLTSCRYSHEGRRGRAATRRAYHS